MQTEDMKNAPIDFEIKKKVDLKSAYFFFNKSNGNLQGDHQCQGCKNIIFEEDTYFEIWDSSCDELCEIVCQEDCAKELIAKWISTSKGCHFCKKELEEYPSPCGRCPKQACMECVKGSEHECPECYDPEKDALRKALWNIIALNEAQFSLWKIDRALKHAKDLLNGFQHPTVKKKS